MNVELEEIHRFLADHEPFRTLPPEALSQLTRALTITYTRRNDTLISAGERNDYLYVIRSGAVDVLDAEGILLDRREAGRSFGYSTLVQEPESKYTMIAVEDSLLLRLHRDDFHALASNNPDLQRFYSGQSARILAVAQQLRQEDFSDVLRTRLGSFEIKNPAHIAPTVTVQNAAQIMGELNVSSLLIMADGTLDGELVGIVTDRDMRRAVAEGRDAAGPVSSIMTPNVRTASADDLVMEAMLLMAELNIHHIPIVDGGVTSGIITSADIMRLLQANPIYLAGDMQRATTAQEMRDVLTNAQHIAVRFVERGAAAEEVSGLMTVVADSMARQLLTLGERRLGSPPVPYTFVAVGSQGRREMGLASDQDNALILSDDYDEQAHGEYFSQLTRFVCEGLAEAGQELCPGEMMAMNPQWRMTVSQWERTFHTWITAPEPDALLYAQTFFDMRGIFGDTALVDAVHGQAMASAQNSPRLHAHLAALAARREPPIGFFRGLVVDKAGEYRNTLDVKKGGTAAIVQMGRLYAIVAGSDALRTHRRLEGHQDLAAAYEFLGSIALRHQAEQARRGQEPDYHVDPRALSKMDREHLRDAFHIIKNTQAGLSLAYPVRSI